MGLVLDLIMGFTLMDGIITIIGDIDLFGILVLDGDTPSIMVAFSTHIMDTTVTVVDFTDMVMATDTATETT